MRQIPADEFLELFDPLIYESLRQALARFPEATHLVCFADVELVPKEHRPTTAVVVGPGCTFSSPDACKGSWLGDMPSERQYPYACVPRDEISAALA